MLDRQLLGASNGASGTVPEGLFNYAGQSMTAIGTLSLDDLLDAEALALGANVNPDALKWVMTSREFIALRKIKALTSGSNQYVFLRPDPTKTGAYSLFGKPVVITNHLTDTTGSPNTGNMALVDFSQIVAVPRPRALGQAPRPDVRGLRSAGDQGGGSLRREAAQR